MDMKKRLAEKIYTLLELEITGIKVEEIEEAIEIPKNKEFGDFALPCFLLSKSFKRAPNQLAQDLVPMLKSDFIADAKAVGPYINFFIISAARGQVVLNILAEKDRFGKTRRAKPERILIESPGPNTNKPLHIGHLRNMVLGEAVGNILKANGQEVITVNINNDRGVHICKSMLAYKLYGEKAEPDRKTDHFVGHWYVMFAQKLKKHPELEVKNQEMLKKWEEGDPKVHALWEKMNEWAYEGFKETYKMLGFRVNKQYYESETYKKGKEFVQQGLKDGIFSQDETGRVIVDLEKEGMGEKTLLRADGTSVYMTQDIALAYQREQDFTPDRMIYVVASEQNLHFRQLFKTLELLGINFAKKCYHLSYGMIKLPDGKMKSREGTVVDTDDLIAEMIQEAKREITAREPRINKDELEKRSKIIALGAIKFFILRYDPVKDFVFDKKKSVSFEGATGAYVQYAYVRIHSILDKEVFDIKQVDVSTLKEPTERLLVNLLNEYPKLIEQAANQYKPSLIANYLIELTQTFSNFYNEVTVLKERENTIRHTRLALLRSVSTVIRNGLDILGIKVPKKM